MSGFGSAGVGGVAIKLTFSFFQKIVFLVTSFSVGWLMNPPKSDFEAPKNWP